MIYRPLQDNIAAFHSSSTKRPPEPLQLLTDQCDKHISPQEKLELSTLLSSYLDRFNLPGTRLGRTDIINHDINTTA